MVVVSFSKSNLIKVFVAYLSEFSVASRFTSLIRIWNKVFFFHIDSLFVYTRILHLIRHTVSDLMSFHFLFVWQAVCCTNISPFKVFQFWPMTNQKMTSNSILIKTTIIFVVLSLLLFQQILLCLLRDKLGVHGVTFVEHTLILRQSCLFCNLQQRWISKTKPVKTNQNVSYRSMDQLTPTFMKKVNEVLRSGRVFKRERRWT